MPMRAPRACSRTGCGGTTAHPCAHPRQRATPWANRPSARARGYTYAWDERSRELRKAGVLCAYCTDEPMVALDHRVPLSQGGSTNPDENGVPIGQRCHAKKTASESAAARRRPA